MTNDYWDSVYRTKPTDHLSWFQTQATTSLRLIEDTGISHDAPIIDVGSGASCLIDGLVAAGFNKITALDLSPTALQTSQARLGEAKSAHIHWLVGDVLTQPLPKHHFGLWHDRAVFHFLTQTEQQQAYIERVRESVQDGGYVVIATFAEDGPERCSGLPIKRYSATQLAAVFGAGFELVHAEREVHKTPQGGDQSFIYCVLRVA